MASFFNTFREAFRLVDILDIAVVAVCLYFTLVWLHQKASRSLLVALVCILVLFVAARRYDMYLTASLFQFGTTVLIFGLMLVFQDDIRRLFERLATWGRFREEQATGDLANVIDQLVETAGLLAERQVGALIVIKGRELIERHIRGGVVLNGKLSLPLLYSLFDVGSPGHDGAVLIERGRIIEKFGVHLPLSHNLAELGHHGTRHAAALGLAECCDSLIVVVSEERGKVSLAEEGRLQRLENLAELKVRLEKHYKRLFGAHTQASWLTRMRRNLWLKLLSLCLASLYWFQLAHQVETVARSFFVPVELRNLPPEWELEGSDVVEARVTLSGEERTFRQLDPQSLRISVNLANVSEGRQELYLTDDSLNHPPDLNVVQIVPRHLELAAYRMVSVSLPVEVVFEGRLPAGRELVGYRVQPSHVQLTLRRSAASRTSQVATEPVDLAALKQTGSVEVKLSLPPGARQPEDAPSTVRISFEVAPVDDAPQVPDEKPPDRKDAGDGNTPTPPASSPAGKGSG